MFLSIEFSASSLFAGFLVSTVGFSVFLYGKKQARPPQLVAGLLLLVLPMALPGAMLLTGVSIAVIAATWLVVRAGY